MGRRVGVCLLIIFLLANIIMLRLLVVATDEEYQSLADSQNSYDLVMSTTRGDILDRNMESLVNVAKGYAGLVYLEYGEELSDMDILSMTSSSKETLVDNLQVEKPFIVSLTNDYNSDNITAVQIFYRYMSSQLACHIIGYTDSDGVGVTGIEKSYDDLLTGATTQTIASLQTDGYGSVVTGCVPLIYNTSAEDIDIVLTIDKTIQKIAEQAMSDVEKGAVIIEEIATGDIVASVSKPSFDPTDITSSLDSTDSPFLNRAFLSYNVGSIFKIVVAAAALESGVSADTTFECLGVIDVSGQEFHCHNLAGHGVLDMEGAFAVSCNCYFIQLGQLIGYDKVYSMAVNMGLDSETYFTEDIYSESGNLPLPITVISPAQSANIFFGQGELLATPYQLNKISSIIASGGILTSSNLIYGINYWGVLDTSMRNTGSIRVMSQETADTVKQFMISVVQEGSGSRAEPETGGAGGKTGSAQTGFYDEDGVEIVHAWFSGFYPADDPMYAITVFVENGQEGSTAAAPIFKEIADNI